MVEERGRAGVVDVAIIGGGVIGLSCAESLLERGRSVRILEKGTLGCGSSWGNCGLITPSHAPPLAQPGMTAKALASIFRRDSPFYVKPRLDPRFLSWGLSFFRHSHRRAAERGLAAKAGILRLSRQLLGDLIDRERLACEWDASGLFMVYRTAEEMAAGDAWDDLIAEAGIPFEKLDGAELARREPALVDGLAGARYYPTDAMLRPDRLVAELARLVAELGGEVEEGTEVDGLSSEPGGEVDLVTSKGRVRARTAIVATGAWSPRFSRMLGLSIPIQPGKGYTVTAGRPAHSPRYPLLFEGVKVAVTPWPSGFRVGSTMEFAGYDTTLNRVRLDALWRGARQYLKDCDAPGEKVEWYGWRPMTPDDLPLLGPVPRLPNVFLAAGHNMLGVSMATATGEILASMICREDPPIDTAPYHPLRF